MVWQDLGISGGTAVIVLLAFYFVIKSAVKNGIKQAYKDITGNKSNHNNKWVGLLTSLFNETQPTSDKKEEFSE